MPQVDMILQGKGGVGKSFIASLIAQHCKGLGVETVCIDTDPVNATFSGYKAYGVSRIELFDGDDIDPLRFDELVDAMMQAPEGSVVTVDNGAATFVPLCAYLLESGAVGVLREAGRGVRFHTVVTGGQAEQDTLKGFDALCGNCPDVPTVVWGNEYFGRIARGTKGGCRDCRSTGSTRAACAV